MSNIRVLMIGDLVGPAGIKMFEKHIGSLKEKYKADAIIVNGENSADNGRGITPAIADHFFEMGVNVITTGNHIWAQKKIFPYIVSQPNLLRPANYPSKCPGSGSTIINIGAYKVAVVNLQGRVFMREQLDDPFKTIESLLQYLKHQTDIIFVDFHAETTAETAGIALFLDGQVSAVVGTHTHIQTADARVLPAGTAFMTDLGMGGSLNSMIGMKKDIMIHHLRTQMPVRFEVDLEPPYVMSGACIEVDTQTGQALSIEAIRVVDDQGLF